MKRLLFCISLLIYIQMNLLGQAIIGFNITHGRPSIRSITPLSPTAYNEGTQGTTFNLDSIIDEIQYYDGLGRPMQVVQRAMSPEAYYIRIADGSGIIDETITIHKDLVVHQEYDAAGRQSTSWLPTISSYAGALIPLDILKENAKNQYQDSAYSRPVYEASPLNRVSEQYGPGKRWYNSGKSVKTEYLTNKGTSGELSCIWFTVDGQGMNTTLNKKGYYNDSELYVTKITNEEGSITNEFKDKLGQVLLTRQINTNSELFDTYYVYDNFGNLSFVIPPIASEIATKGNLSTENLDLYGYQYKYDSRKRCVQKQLPGAKYISYIYDKADRLIFTQDGEQRTDKEWLFALSDALGRTVLTGICKNTDITNEKYQDLLVEAEAKDDGTYNGYNLLVNGQKTSFTGVKLLTVNYYDNYNFLGKYTPNWQFESKDGYGARFTGDNEGYETKGLLTGTSVAVLDVDGSDTFLHSVSFYDNRGRLVQTISNNHLEGEDKTWFAYSYTDWLTKQLHEHTAKGKDTQTELYTYTYDRAGRQTQTDYKLNDLPQIILAENKYNKIGLLESSTPAGASNLKTAYKYNIRSWTEAITHLKFKEVLEYTYSGNIHKMIWKQDTDTQDREYTFDYDPLSRLKEAKYKGLTTEDYSTTYSYDKHGNMKTLTRMGMVNYKPELIDDLSFDYTGNQRLSVEDHIQGILDNSSTDFKDYNKKADIAVEYTYNTNGAMTMDLNKGIQNIKYNILNLPQELEIEHPTAKAKNYYTYTATGTKLKVVYQSDVLQKEAPSGAGSQENEQHTIDYVGNIIYEDGVLDKILFDNGYYQDGNYYFYVRDHLGNNRLVTDAAASVVQSNHYYPFGMSFAESTNQEKQPYKYNNKELDDRAGLNWYDYSARMKDDWGFTTPDPLSEKFYSWSPYVYTFNNPMRFTDPTGMEPAGESGWADFWVDFLSKIFSGDGTDEERNNKAKAEIGKYKQQNSEKNRQIGDEAITLIETTNDYMLLANPYGVAIETTANMIVGEEVTVGDIGWSLASIGPLGIAGKGGKSTKVAAQEGFNILNAFKNAISPFKGGKLTNVGRAITKHPSYFGFESTEALMKVYRTPEALNKLGSSTLKDILRNGVKTTGAGGRYPNGWVTYTLPNGNAASWGLDGSFIGFRGIK